MEKHQISRRKALSGIATLAAALAVPSSLFASRASKTSSTFSYCLNTSTIMGQQLGLVKEIETAAQAGFDGVEIWINALNQYQAEGGSLRDLRQRTQDLGIRIENAIGFAPWIVDDNDTRIQALEQAHREMDMLAQIGCPRLAAPPAGATAQPGLDLQRAGERYRALLELGTEMGVMPQLEIWGFSKNLSRLSQVLFVAAESGHPGARILPDIYHLYKGGSDFDGLKLISGPAIEIFHLNDYPAEPPRTEIQDQDRLYPGDGIAPIPSILRDLAASGTSTILSLELFNRTYWLQDPLEVARTGLAKMKAAVGGS